MKNKHSSSSMYIIVLLLMMMMMIWLNYESKNLWEERRKGDFNNVNVC